MLRHGPKILQLTCHHHLQANWRTHTGVVKKLIALARGQSRLQLLGAGTKGKTIFPQRSYRGSYFSMGGFLIAALFPKLVSLHALLGAAAALSVKLVSLHDFALGCRCRLVSQASLPDFAFGCRCCLVCEACFLSRFRSWPPLPPCL